MWKNQAFLPDRYFLKLAFKFLFRCWQPCKYGKAHLTEHESTKLKPKLDMLVQAGTSIFALWKVILLKKRIWKNAPCVWSQARHLTWIHDGQWMERHTWSACSELWLTDWSWEEHNGTSSKKKMFFWDEFYASNKLIHLHEPTLHISDSDSFKQNAELLRVKWSP